MENPRACPLRTPATSNSPPPPIICIPEASTGDLGIGNLLVKTVPRAQENAPVKTTIAPQEPTLLPANTSGRITSMIMPINPMKSAATIRRLGRVADRVAISRSAVQSEMDDISSAETPEGTCWATQLKPPWQIRKNRAPMEVAATQLRQVRRVGFRICAKANNTNPARKKRVPATKKGGIVATAKRVAKNVEPQMR